MIRRDRFEHLRRTVGAGIKILRDIVATGRGRLRIGEIPYASRAAPCESKRDSMWPGFPRPVAAKMTATVSLRFLRSRCRIDRLVVHLGVRDVAFTCSVSLHGPAPRSPHDSNFLLNNIRTYRDHGEGMRGCAAVAFYLCAASAVAMSALRLGLRQQPIWWGGAAGGFDGRV